MRLAATGFSRYFSFLLLVSIISITLTACGGGDKPNTLRTIGGTVSGFTGGGTLRLQMNNQTLDISQSGNFQFQNAIPDGTKYDVKVVLKPTILTCLVTNGNGTATADVSNIRITCSSSGQAGGSFTVSGTASGLTGGNSNMVTLVLSSGGQTEEKMVMNTTSFAFNTGLALGASYTVTVKPGSAQPLNSMVCTPNENYEGIIAQNVTNVSVVCSTTSYTVSGSITGLAGSAKLRLNNVQELPLVANNTNYSFTQKVASGSKYVVDVLEQPINPGVQRCAFANDLTQSTGTVLGNVTMPQITCVSNSRPFRLNVTAAGLPFSTTLGVSATVNGSNYTVNLGSNNVPTAFPNLMLGSGDSYSLSIPTQPSATLSCKFVPSQQTSVSGSVFSSNARDISVAVACSAVTANTGQYKVAGTLVGLPNGASVTLMQGSEPKVISSTSPITTIPFEFTNRLNNNASYEVTVGAISGANGYICSRDTLNGVNYKGTISSADVTNVKIVCGVARQISGSVNNLGPNSGLMLSSSTGDMVTIAASQVSYTVNNQVADGSWYTLGIMSSPTGLACTFSDNNSTTISKQMSSVTSSVSVNCVAGSGGVSGTVLPLYPTNGRKWNDYVGMNTSASALLPTVVRGSDALPCDGFSACLHGGELRYVDVQNGDCTGVTAADSSDAFNWTCYMNGNSARVVSTGFKAGKGLSDLLLWQGSTPTWKAMSLTVTRNSTNILSTSTIAWWDNPIVAANVSTQLNASGTIYTISQDTAASYDLGADKVALVVGPNGTLTALPSSAYNVNANTKKYLWIEGKMAGVLSSNADGVVFDSVNFSTINSLRIKNIKNRAVSLFASLNNRLQSIVANDAQYGIYLEVSNRNLLLNNTTSHNIAATTGSFELGSGLLLNSSTANVISNHNAFSNSGQGVAVTSGSNDNVFTNITAANNGGGILVQNYAGTTGKNSNLFMNVTVPNNDLNGVTVGGDNNTFANLAVVNTGSQGIEIQKANTRLINVASAQNNSGPSTTPYEAVFLRNSSNTSVIGSAFLSGGCKLQGSDNGLTPTCAGSGTSTATISTTADLSNAFVGKVLANDNANPSTYSSTNGTITLQSIIDWGNFANNQRGWAFDSNTTITFPSYVQQGSGLNSPSTVMRPWDWSLKLASVLLNVQNNSNSLVTDTHITSSGASKTFVTNAYEVMGDGIGNDDGLCESNETCMQAPNIGSYQGHGIATLANASASGTGVSNVRLLKYSTNGY